MKPLDLGCYKIDICPNFFILYYLENTNLTKCRTCGYARYKPGAGRGMTLLAIIKLRYFSITHRLQISFLSSNIVKHMTWYHSQDDVVD